MRIRSLDSEFAFREELGKGTAFSRAATAAQPARLQPLRKNSQTPTRKTSQISLWKTSQISLWKTTQISLWKTTQISLWKTSQISLWKPSQMPGAPWKSGPSGPRKPCEISAGFSPRGRFSSAKNLFAQSVQPQRPGFFLTNKFSFNFSRIAA
jgi:hypothetical protein